VDCAFAGGPFLRGQHLGDRLDQDDQVALSDRAGGQGAASQRVQAGMARANVWTRILDTGS
jgi:hypothetical protein